MSDVATAARVQIDELTKLLTDIESGAATNVAARFAVGLEGRPWVSPYFTKGAFDVGHAYLGSLDSAMRVLGHYTPDLQYEIRPNLVQFWLPERMYEGAEKVPGLTSGYFGALLMREPGSPAGRSFLIGVLRCMIAREVVQALTSGSST